MNILQFAVGSMVDANTRNGLEHYSNVQDDVPLEPHGRKFLSISIAGLISAFKTKITAAIDRCTKKEI